VCLFYFIFKPQGRTVAEEEDIYRRKKERKLRMKKKAVEEERRKREEEKEKKKILKFLEGRKKRRESRARKKEFNEDRDSEFVLFYFYVDLFYNVYILIFSYYTVSEDTDSELEKQKIYYKKKVLTKLVKFQRERKRRRIKRNKKLNHYYRCNPEKIKFLLCKYI
jgi:hypothetical protein